MNPQLFWRLVKGVVRSIVYGRSRDEQRETANRIHQRVTERPISEPDEREVNGQAHDAARRGRELDRFPDRPAPRYGGQANPLRPDGPLPSLRRYDYETIVVWRDGEGAEHRSQVVVVSDGQISGSEVRNRSRAAFNGDQREGEYVQSTGDFVPVVIDRIIIVDELPIVKRQ